ncbi:hypothetical protein QFZ48_006124 [Chitinophaga sp. W2I13]|uniref:carboxypeptidase-like regulatory domain-containing protein n=1 Tax=Chitinophaga sp. W2I13 TaxID=3373923 RepID=UPI003D226652
MKKTEKLKHKPGIVRLSISRILTIALFTACLLARPPLSLAQDKAIHGRVTGDGGDPVLGASVAIKGTNKGQTTNANGEFSLVAAKGAVLIISSIGYASQEIRVEDNTTIKVQLTAATKDIGEVVVVGYGTQRKKDLTGAVASVNLETLREAPNTNIGQYLQEPCQG